jgi:hypothetical protein
MRRRTTSIRRVEIHPKNKQIINEKVAKRDKRIVNVWEGR